MPRLETETKNLLAALVPLRAYAKQSRGRPNLTAYAMNHIGEIEAALNAVADYAKAADGILNPEPTPLVARVRRLLAFQNDPAPLTRHKLAAYLPFPA